MKCQYYAPHSTQKRLKIFEETFKSGGLEKARYFADRLINQVDTPEITFICSKYLEA